MASRLDSGPGRGIPTPPDPSGSLATANAPQEYDHDLRLVQQALAGEASAREELIRLMQDLPPMVSVINNRSGRPLPGAALDDLVQDCLETVWFRLPAYTGRSSLPTWLFGICTNNFMAAQRAIRRRSNTLYVDDLPDLEAKAQPPPSPDGEGPLREYGRVHWALERLPVTWSRIVRLKHFDALSFSQIAARLTIPSNTVKTHYYRALGELRALLGPSYIEEVS